MEGNQLGGKIPCITFPLISTLNLASTGIRSLSEIHQLISHFPALSDLEVRGNAWYDDPETKNARGTIIALFPQIFILNGTVVSEQERKEEELAYLNQSLTQIASALGLAGVNELQGLGNHLQEKMETVETMQVVARLMV